MYTHEKHQPVDEHYMLYHYLNTTFTASVRRVKERFGLEEKEVLHLRPYNGFDKAGKKPKPNPNFHYYFKDSTDKLTDKGLAFLCCLFLDKHYATIMLKKLKGFKDGRDPGSRATLEVYSAYRAKLPQTRIESTDNLQAFALDMLNELQRCPEPLFELLSTDDRKKFEVFATDATGAETDEQVLLRRSDNRFPYFAMRYLDEREAFKQLRFHIDLGTYYFDCYDKMLVDGSTEQRYLTSHIKGFGRLQELSEDKDYLVELDANNEIDKPFESHRTNTRPHYHLNSPTDSLIGIKLVDERKTTKCVPQLNNSKPNRKEMVPDAWLCTHELPAIILITLLQNGDTQKGMNAAEQVILKHYAAVRKIFTLVQDGDTLLEPYINKQKSEDDFYREFGLRFNQLPTEICEYITGEHTCPSPEADAKKRIQWFTDDSDKRLKQLERQLDTIQNYDAKPGKRRYPTLKAGVMASFLAEDMMRLQPSIGKTKGSDKLSSPNFRSLQANLAFFGKPEVKASLAHIFRKCGLTDKQSPNKHPFLGKLDVDKYNSIADFYRGYLLQRKEYFNACILGVKGLPHAVRNNKLKQKSEQGTDYYRQLAGRLLKQPVNLPRNLFIDKVRELLGRHPAMADTLANPQTNTTYLIQHYVAQVLNDSPQPFYDFTRKHKLWDSLNGKQASRNPYEKIPFGDLGNAVKAQVKKLNASIGKGCKDDEKIKKIADSLPGAFARFNQSEKELRQYKVQDMLTFMMGVHLLTADKDSGLKLEQHKLQNVMPNSERSILSQPVKASLLLSRQERKEDTSWVVVQEGIKLKNYGDFRRIARDRRIQQLGLWICEKEVKRSELENELKSYDDLRTEVFRTLHQFEERLYETYGESIAHENQKYISFSELLAHFNMVWKKLPEPQDANSALSGKEQEQQKQLLAIRNAFGHNQYPNLFAENRPFSITNGVAKYLYQQLEGTIKHYLNELQDILNSKNKP